MKKFILSIFTFLLTLPVLFAQDKVPMADGLRSEGKIYVVVIVMLVIFVAIAIYLFSLDRKITKLEKNDK